MGEFTCISPRSRHCSWCSYHVYLPGYLMLLFFFGHFFNSATELRSQFPFCHVLLLPCCFCFVCAALLSGNRVGVSSLICRRVSC
mgnify:CR=1 FL=1